MQRALRIAGVLFCTGLATGRWADAEAIATVPIATYAAQLGSAHDRAGACTVAGAACTAAGLPGRERVMGGPNGAFTVSWQWFADALSSAGSAAPPDRLHAMQAADAHLRVLGAQSGQGQAGDGAAREFARARAAATAALSGDEFRASEGPSWFDRKVARLQDWFLRLFEGMDRLGRRAPWLAPLIEWSCFGLAVAGLLWFVRQSLQRQTLRIALSEGAALTGTGGREAADWERMAEEQATAGSWRDAVHSLYWAAIALLEARRTWRPNTTRTPREYLRLLRPGSDAHRALGELTRDLERVWYGLARAEEAHYRAAHAELEALRASKPERAGREGEGATGRRALLPAGSD